MEWQMFVVDIYTKFSGLIKRKIWGKNGSVLWSSLTSFDQQLWESLNPQAMALTAVGACAHNVIPDGCLKIPISEFEHSFPFHFANKTLHNCTKVLGPERETRS